MIFKFSATKINNPLNTANKICSTAENRSDLNQSVNRCDFFVFFHIILSSHLIHHSQNSDMAQSTLGSKKNGQTAI